MLSPKVRSTVKGILDPKCNHTPKPLLNPKPRTRTPSKVNSRFPSGGKLNLDYGMSNLWITPAKFKYWGCIEVEWPCYEKMQIKMIQMVLLKDHIEVHFGSYEIVLHKHTLSPYKVLTQHVTIVPDQFSTQVPNNYFNYCKVIMQTTIV